MFQFITFTFMNFFIFLKPPSFHLKGRRLFSNLALHHVMDFTPAHPCFQCLCWFCLWNCFYNICILYFRKQQNIQFCSRFHIHCTIWKVSCLWNTIYVLGYHNIKKGRIIGIPSHCWLHWLIQMKILHSIKLLM